MTDKKEELAARLRMIGFDPDQVEDQVKKIMAKHPNVTVDDLNIVLDAKYGVVVTKKDALPKSLEGVLGDIDVTAELKRRLEAKKALPHPIQEDCECKSLSDAEMMAAVQTAHDIRTGRLDPKDIASPVELHPRLVEAAVCAPARAEVPMADSRWRQLAGMKQKKLHDDVEEDLKLSKKVVESLIEKRVVEENQRAAALEIMASALQRQRDKEVVFVPVSGLDPRQAAQRVIKLKEEYDEVEPVDLTGVLDDVNPICDLHIERLQGIMNVKKALDLDGVPDEIRFVIPNVDLPAPAETDPDDLKFAMTRYVHFDSMPKELQDVVRSYLSVRRGIDTLASRRFKKAIADLAKKAEVTFGNDPDAA